MNTINTGISNLPISGGSSAPSGVASGLSATGSWFSPDIDPSKSISAISSSDMSSLSVDQLADQVLSHISIGTSD